MFRIKKSLRNACVYPGMVILASGCIRAQIKKVYASSSPTVSSLVTKDTKIIFRSESAKFFIFIQISSDLFEVDGYDLRWEKAMHKFIPELFDLWKSNNTNHVVSIVIFGRVYYSKEDYVTFGMEKDSAVRKVEVCSDNMKFLAENSFQYHKDFYKVLADWENKNDWSDIMRTLKVETLGFHRSILNYKNFVVGELSPSYHGNILEAVNMALNIFSKHYIDRDLARTGLSIVLLSASSGLFYVGKSLLRLTNERMMDEGVGLDLICLNSPPLYCTPMFHVMKTISPIDKNNSDLESEELLYADNNNTEFYISPHWVDISYVYDDTENFRLPASLFRPFVNIPYIEDDMHYRKRVSLISGNDSNTLKSISKSPAKAAGLLTKQLSEKANSKNISKVQVTPPYTIKVASQEDQNEEKLQQQSSHDSISRTSVLPIHIEGRKTPDRMDNQNSSSLKIGSHSKSYGKTMNSSSGSESMFGQLKSKRNAGTPKPLDPCNPSKSRVKLSSHMRRWQHVFPEASNLESEPIKWKSLCSPACLPLTTDYFPSEQELIDEYQEYNYTVSLNLDGSNVSVSDNLIQELISQRLMQGFQLVIGLPNIPNGKLSPIGSRSWTLIMGQQIHRLQYDPAAQNVEVKRLVKKSSYLADSFDYSCDIWTKYSSAFIARYLTFRYPSSSKYAWNYLDQVISGYQEELTESLRYWRARFIFVPMKPLPPNIHVYTQASNENFTDEELHLAGFMKFIELLRKVRWIPKEERDTFNSKFLLTNTFIPITFTTFTASRFVQNEIAKWNSNDPNLSYRKTNQNQSTKKFTIDTKLSAISSAMQHPKNGVQFKDRRWHLRFYERVFIGLEFVDWLIFSFSDIDTREKAVNYGQYLLEKGLFEHVNQKHPFLDGHFFYRMKQEYLVRDKDEPRSGPMKWFKLGSSSQKLDLTENAKPAKMEKIELSRKIEINVDPQGKSQRDEWAIIHYDTTHNPRNCYHFHLHWLVCTSRLVEDLIQYWTRSAEKFGLKLVEAPLEQAKLDAIDSNPFHSSVHIKLAVDPPSIDKESLSYKTIEIPESYFEIELIKHFDFLLDVEADHMFPQNAVNYSFYRPPYKYTQYIHRSGTAFIQLLPKDGFLWTNNRLVQESPDQLLEGFKSFCSKEEKLNDFWQETYEKLIAEKGKKTFLDDIPDRIAQFDDQLNVIPIDPDPERDRVRTRSTDTYLKNQNE